MSVFSDVTIKLKQDTQRSDVPTSTADNVVMVPPGAPFDFSSPSKLLSKQNTPSEGKVSCEPTPSRQSSVSRHPLSISDLASRNPFRGGVPLESALLPLS